MKVRPGSRSMLTISNPFASFRLFFTSPREIAVLRRALMPGSCAFTLAWDRTGD